jgi:hypothetical protein
MAKNRMHSAEVAQAAARQSAEKVASEVLYVPAHIAGTRITA